MPIINLPQDTRWGDLGKGLAGAAEQIAKAYVEKQTNEGVAAILQDPNIAEAKRPGEILKKYGNPGIAALAKLNALDEQRATITQKLAGAGLQAVQAALGQATLPSAGPKAAAEVATEQARPALLAGQTAQAVGAGAENQAQAANITALTGPKVGTEQALGGLRGNESRKAGEEADILARRKALLDQEMAPEAATPAPGAAVAPAGTPRRPSDVMIEPYVKAGVLKTPEQQEAARAAYRTAVAAGRDPATAVEHFVTSLGTVAARESTEAARVSAAEARDRPVPAAATLIQATGLSSKVAEAHETFVDELTKNPTMVGIMSGGSVKTFLEGKLGIGTGDVPLLRAWEAQHNALATQAQASKSLSLSGAALKMSQYLTNNINNSAVLNLLTSNEQARGEIAKLQGEKDALKGTKTQTAGWDTAIARWERVKEKTDLQAYDYTDARGATQNIVTWNGNFINPVTGETLIGAAEKLKGVPTGGPQTGAELLAKTRMFNDSARVSGASGVSPMDVYAQYRQAGQRR